MKSKWGWPLCETLHFLGLSMLVGTIGLFDLRVLGLAKRIPITPLHRLAPWGIAGYALNVVTGLMFLTTYPYQYVYNSAWLIKMLLMGFAGANAIIFNLFIFRKVDLLGPGDDAPLVAKFMAGFSLCLWILIIYAGRLIAFYRPAFITFN